MFTRKLAKITGTLKKYEYEMYDEQRLNNPGKLKRYVRGGHARLASQSVLIYKRSPKHTKFCHILSNMKTTNNSAKYEVPV